MVWKLRSLRLAQAHAKIQNIYIWQKVKEGDVLGIVESTTGGANAAETSVFLSIRLL